MQLENFLYQSLCRNFLRSSALRCHRPRRTPANEGGSGKEEEKEANGCGFVQVAAVASVTLF
jgi:hypothetical protein